METKRKKKKKKNEEEKEKSCSLYIEIFSIKACRPRLIIKLT